MARDYKNAGRGRSKTKKTLPGWIWMISGLSIGLFVALLVYLDKNPAQKALHSSRPVVSVSKPAQDTREVKKTPPGESIPAPPRFDFYTLLPELEVVIPDDNYTVKDETTARKPSKPLNATERDEGNYVLQVGSFKQHQEADRLKASLALLGVQAHIQKVEVNNDIWHRVRVGPYATLSEVNSQRKRLRDGNIDTILLKVRN